MALVNAAVEKGAVFLPNTQAILGSSTSSVQEVIVRSNGAQALAKTRVVLAADGLSGNFSGSWMAGADRRAGGVNAPVTGVMTDRARPTELNPAVRNGSAEASLSRNSVVKDSRIGAAVIVDKGPAFYQSETIYMACGAGGYVGLVRLEDGRLNVAAAFDPVALRATGQAGWLADRILYEAGLPRVPEILQMPWKGTPRLTRHARCLAGERFFVLGDAASFVEPFTGEGIAWALRSATAVAPLAARGVQGWKPGLEKEWIDTFHREVVRRQMICRLTAGVLRRPRLTKMLVRLLAFIPSLSSPVIRQLNARGGKFGIGRKGVWAS
jgi:flavin-dependent dehydrogenase